MFFTLLKYEFKKLFKKKSVWITVIISILFLPATLLANVLFYSMNIETERGSLHDGYYAVLKADIEQDKELSGRVIDDDFIEFLREAEKVTEKGKSYDKNSPEYIKYVRAYEYAREYLLLDDSDEIKNADELYRMRSEAMENDYTFNRLNEAEKQYLKAMEETVEKPFTYRYCQGCATLIQGIPICGMLLVFASAICVPGIFTEDKRTKADRIVLSSKHGKTLVYAVKTTAAVIFCITVFLLSLFTGLILFTVFFGTEGYDAPVQMLDPFLSLDITCGEAALILTGMGIAEGVILSMLCMIISEVTGSSTPSSVVLFVMLMIGFILNVDPSHRVLSRLWNILPTKITMWSNVFSSMLFGFSGHYFMTYQAAPVIYFIVCAALVFFGYRHYKNYQPK